MSNKGRSKGMKKITISMSQETADRCERLRLAGARKGYMNSAFARVIFNIGLAHYEKVILPIEKEEMVEGNKTAPTDRLAAGYETAPEAMQHTETKIIPFPGVSIDHEVTYQNAFDDFLREIGYITED
jgi:hypothetical protein